MIQEVSSMTIAQSLIGVASSSNIKCSFCLCEECEQQHDYFISHSKELTDIFKEMTYNIDVHTSKKISQPLKCRSITLKPKRQREGAKKEKEKEKEKEEEEEEMEEEEEKEQEKKEKVKVKKNVKDKEKKKEKKVEVVSCDVKQQNPFEGFNIDGEGQTELMTSFSQWINEGLYKHHAKKRDKDDNYLANCSDLEFKQLDFVVAFPKKKDYFYVMSQLNNVVPEYENKIVGTIKGFGIPVGLPWHLTNEVYVPVNCNGEFHWVLAVVVLKEWHIKVYDSMSSSRTNRKWCTEIQKLSTMLPKYLESSGFYEKKDRANWSVLESYQGKKKSHPFEVIDVIGIAQQARNSLDCGVFVVAYAEFLSDGLQIPSDGIISQSLRLRYASLLWNYGILKARTSYVSNNEDPQRPRHKKAKFDENVVIKVVIVIFSTTSVVICCDPLLQQGVVALIISNTNIIAPVKIKIVLTKETIDTKIQKRPRTKTCRKKNENSTITLLEELASEEVSSSQVEAEFSQKEYEEREKEKNEVDDDGETAEEVEEEEGNKEEEEEQEKNEVEDDGIKTINAHTFPVHLQPNATGDSIMRSAMGKPFDTFRITLKQNGLEDFFRNSCFGHFLDLLENNNARFQMTMVYELLKTRFIFQNPKKKDEFAIVSGLKCHPPSKPVPEFIVKKEPQRRNKVGKEETRQPTEEQDLVSLVGTSFKNLNLIYLLNDEDTSRKHKELLCLLWFVHNVLLAKDLNNNISLKWVNLSQDIEAFNNYPWGHESFELSVKYLLKPLGPKTNNLFGFHGLSCHSSFDLSTTCDPNIATYDLFIATYDTNIAIDGSYIAKDDPYVAICDTNIATEAHMCQHITHL
ncbi:hypothetical protein H5410_001826 [Solanum commersonii]|uniref:Ubiquitin-like protease family profile domain-containing protein n=1 Tax=Solanum commersonii TaxID=4109 RepID=A0A9J6AZV8_SOLCO|nr:hypothetical protein H5410_001826 [Solanum commersonii]